MENQAKKLLLNDLIVDSFVTELSDNLVFTIKGGGATLRTECTCGRDVFHRRLIAQPTAKPIL